MKEKTESKRRRWTESEDNYLREHYKDANVFINDMAAHLRRSRTSVMQRASTLGLKRPNEVYVRAGKMFANHPNSIKARFQPGRESELKGKKMSPERYEKIKKTMFKKGFVPANHKEVGTERFTKEGYVEVKVAEPDKWKLKHRVVWEQHNGPIPEGHNVQFKDRNKQNLDISNLYIISRSDQLTKENTLHRYPDELKEIILMQRTLKRRIKNNQNKTQNEH